MTYPSFYETYPPFVPPTARTRTLPGVGAGVAAVGAGLAAAGLFALHWVESLGFTDIVKAVKGQPTPSGAKAHFLHLFLSGGAFAVVGLGVLVALLWCSGLLGRQVGTLVAVGVVQALLVGVQAYAVYEYFHGHFHSVGPGVWLTLAGSVTLLVASLIGPRMSQTWR